MLANIHVKNMALIKEADISLGRGLNILSGETGAGKSILLGSIAVALGLQNFKGFAREDADYALSELVFVIENEEQRQALDTTLEQLAFLLEVRHNGLTYLHTLHVQFVGVTYYLTTAYGRTIKKSYITIHIDFRYGEAIILS